MYLVSLKPKNEGNVFIRKVQSDFDREQVQKVLDKLGQTSCGDLVKDFAILMCIASGDLEPEVEYEIEVHEVPDDRAGEVIAALDANCISKH